LVVVLHGDGASVEEDEGDDEPKPPGRLAHLAETDLPATKGQAPVARGTCNEKAGLLNRIC
jgi:hypothetical protein